jgi:PAS domain S-box-containing protein
MDRATNRILDHTLIGEALLTAVVAVVVIDDDGNFVAVNDAAESMLGYAREELRTSKVLDVTARSRDELAELMDELSRRHSLEGTARLRRKDGAVGTIGYVAFQGSVGGLPVVVSVTAPIREFRLEG